MLATQLTAWMQMLARLATPPACEDQRLRLRQFRVAGTIARRSRRGWLHLSAQAPFGHLSTTALTRLDALPHLS